MIVYHGTTLKLPKPDVKMSKRYLDFGKGFYLTTFQEQAERWAVRKAMRSKSRAVVNVYEMKNSLNEYRVLSFEKANDKWLDFVCDCRKGKDVYQDYDIIIGNVANDDVFKTIDRYFRGIWDKERTLEELRYYKMNDQIAIIYQNVLDEIINFKESYDIFY